MVEGFKSNQEMYELLDKSVRKSAGPRELYRGTKQAVNEVLGRASNYPVSYEDFSEAVSIVKRKVWSCGMADGYLLTKEQLLSGNIIDVSEFLKRNRLNPRIDASNYSLPLTDVTKIINDRRQLLADNGVDVDEMFIKCEEYDDAYRVKSILDITPCFEVVTLKVNAKNWLRVRLTNLDVENQTLSMVVNQYYQTPSEGGFASLGTYYVDAFIRDDDVLGLNYHYTTQSQVVHTIVNADKSAFTKSELIIVNSITGIYDSDYDADVELGKKNGLQNNVSLREMNVTYTVITVIAYLNTVLELKSLSKASKPKTKPLQAQYEVSGEDTSNHKSDNRKVRIISGDDISITSEKRPRTPDTQYVRHYSVATWQQRGFVRHLSSGKSVYIAPQVKHRHALKSKDSDVVVPTTLYVE